MKFTAVVLYEQGLPKPYAGSNAFVIEEVGAGVGQLKAGDHVVMTAGGNCGTCRCCMAHKPQLCDAVNANRVAGRLWLDGGNGRGRGADHGEPDHRQGGRSRHRRPAQQGPDLCDGPGGMIFSGRVIRGAMMGGGVAQRDIPRYERIYRQGPLALERLKTAEFGFEGLNEGVDRLDRGEEITQILRPHG